MLYLVTLERNGDLSYEDAWSDNTVIGVFDSLEAATNAVQEDHKKHANGKNEIEEMVKINTEGEQIHYYCAFEWDFENVEYEWIIRPVEVNQVLN
jgi:hypothetical protein